MNLLSTLLQKIQSIPIQLTIAGQVLGTVSIIFLSIECRSKRMQETTIHPPGHFDGELLSSDTLQSIVKFSFNSPTSAVCNAVFDKITCI